jgi:hypothetical protein
MFDRNEHGEDWGDWVPIVMEPVELRNAELDYCRENNIPTRFMRLKNEDGLEYLMIFKKVELPGKI